MTDHPKDPTPEQQAAARLALEANVIRAAVAWHSKSHKGHDEGYFVPREADEHELIEAVLALTAATPEQQAGASEKIARLLKLVGDGECLMRDERVRFRNGMIDVDASSANMEWNEEIRGIIADATEAIARLSAPAH